MKDFKSTLTRTYKAVKFRDNIEAGELESTVFRFFRVDSQLAETILFTNLEGDLAEARTVYTYNNKSQLKREEFYYSSRLYSTREYDYDEKSRLKAEIYKVLPDGVTKKKIYKYDNDRLVEIKEIEDEKLISGKAYYYDRKKYIQILLDLERQDKGQVACFITLDAQNYKIKEEFFYSKDKSRIIQNYNTNGKIDNGKVYSSNGSFNHNRNIEYNKYGDMVEMIDHYKDSIHKEVFQYIYDSKGNWVKRIMFQNDEPLKIVTREIEYK